MVRKFIYLASVSSLVLAGPALAQDATIEADETTQAAEQAPQVEETDKNALTEVIVTAQRRAENIQDVPLSVSAISGDILKDRAIDKIDDVARLTPNIDISALPRTSYIRIRGLGSGDNKGFEQSIGLFVDGVYFGRAEYLNDAMLDIEQVEILRGPQGTLFGKNTVAGALNIMTANPGPEWELYASGILGDFEQKRFEGAINAPLLNDDLAIRIAGKVNKRDGYIYNRLLDRDEANIDKSYVRGKIGFYGIDNLEIVASFDYGTIDGRGNGYQLSKLGPDAQLVYSLFDPDLETDLDDFETGLDYPGYTLRDTVSANLTATLDLWDHQFVSITGWSRYDFVVSDDVDFGPAPMLSFLYDDEFEQVSQEFRVVSPPGDFEYVGGLYYFYSDYDAKTDFTMFPDFDLLDVVQQNLLGNALGGLLGPLLGGLPVPAVTVDNRHKEFRQQVNHYAAYVQANWHVTDWFTLIGGLRVSRETKNHFQQQSFDGTGLLYALITGDETFAASADRSQSDVSPKVSVKVDLSEDVMAYATFAQGFKGGGYNEQAANAQDMGFRGEKSDTYEAGVKSTLWDGRMTLNAGYFYTAFDNLQVAVWDGTGFIVTNAEGATSQGVEVETSIMPVSWLTVSGGLGWTDATYDDFTQGPCRDDQNADRCDLSGERLNQAPEWNMTAAIVADIPLFDLPVNLLIGGNIYYQTEMFLTPDLDIDDSQEAYTLVGAQVGVKDRDGLWAFTVIGRNLTDEVVKQESFDVPLFSGSHFAAVGPPRTVVAEFKVNF